MGSEGRVETRPRVLALVLPIPVFHDELSEKNNVSQQALSLREWADLLISGS